MVGVRLRSTVMFGVPVVSLLAAASLWVAVTTVSGRQGTPAPETGRPLRVLFLGQREARPHDPAKMLSVVAPGFARKGIQFTYAATPAEALSSDTLAYYDALVIYGDEQTLTPAETAALTEFVSTGHGLLAIHSGVGMFAASDGYANLVGARMQAQGTSDVTAEITQSAHPAVQGVQPFPANQEAEQVARWNPGNQTLMEQVSARGRQPWTWVRTEGRGRVFATFYGHDEATWEQPAFQRMLEQAITWAVDEPARQAFQQLKMPEVAYVDGYNVPNYERRDPAPKYQLPLSPADEQKLIAAPAEFKVELFASEPDIVKPIAMAFDERGRLWVIEARDYPNTVLNGQPGDDRIKILEDTDGDGRADKFTLFADGINLGTSLTFANGGVIVAAAPNFLFFKDTNGDDKADVRQVMSTGWGLRDTHAGPSTLQYAYDNHVWGVVGYSGFNGEMNGKPMSFNQVPYRFRPDGSDFEVISNTTNNTWGLGFNETGDVFGSTANGDPSWYIGIPNRYFEGVQGLPPNAPGSRGGPGYQSLAQFTTIHPLTPYIRQVDNQGFYTAGAGHMFYTARAYPKAYWNRIAFVNEPTAHITGQVAIESQGAGYVAKDAWNLLAGAEEWFAPVVSLVGPDGAVWVSDWYNFIAQHNPTPESYSSGRGAAYETSMRDHIRGRIYRVVYRGAPVQKKRSLSKSDPAGLLEALASDNQFWRLEAQRLIVERAETDVVPQLIALVRNRSVDAIGTNGAAFNALWTLEGLGAVKTPGSDAYRAAVEALTHPAAGVRKAAAMVLPRTAEAANAILAAGLTEDRDLHTRLEAVLVLSEMPSSAPVAQAVFKASQVPENFTDPWLSRALYIAANRHQAEFLAIQKADPNAVPFAELSVPLRLGALKPDWRTPSERDLASWNTMPLPGAWEPQGLPNFDGSVWFTRTVTLPAAAPAATLSLGAVRNNAEVWVNGFELTGTRGGARGAAGAPAGRGVLPGLPVAPTATARYAAISYPVADGVLRAGANAITVRVDNTRGDGGFTGQPDELYLETGGTRNPLAGPWRYRVERSANVGTLYSRPGELAAHVAFTAAGGASSAAAAALPVVAQAPDVVVQLGVVANEMKYSTTEITAQPGQLVEVRFTNNDSVQHNFVLGQPGSLEQIGAAADQFARSPGAVVQSYVPDVAQVLVRTPLVNAGQSFTFVFRAPAEAGQYPYLCTFPGHWRMMNGVLNVVQFGRGRGAGGRGAAPAAGRGGPARGNE